MNRINSIILVVSSLLLITTIGCNDRNDSLTDPSTDMYLNKQLEVMEVEHKAHLERLIEYLDLTDEQIVQIKSFFEAQRRDLKNQFFQFSNREKRRFDFERFRSMKDEKFKEFNEFLLTILTDEQKVKFEELHAAIQADHLDEWIAKISEVLELSDDQVAEIKELFEQQAEKMKEIHEGDYSREEKFELIKAVRDEIKSELQSILTTEQLEKLEALLQERIREHWLHDHFGNWRP